MLDRIKAVFDRITKAPLVDEALIKEIVRELQRTLIASDVNVSLVSQLSKKIEKRIADEKELPGVSRKEHLVKVLYDELAEILGGESHKPRMDKHRILLVGLYGQGKTTTAGKLARFYSKHGLKTCMVCTDVYRPAAFQQLKQVGERISVPVFGDEKEKNAIKILENALPKAKGFDLVIVDSAGRDSLEQSLLDEIRAIRERLAPDETYLVMSADIGQTAGVQATRFNAMAPLTGVIITKADSSGKAGGALSACSAAKIPVTFVGSGEKMDDLDLFDAKKYVSRLLGFPDLEGLLGKVKEVIEETEFNPEDLLKGEYTLKAFYKQLEATKKMGPLKKVFGMMGANVSDEMVKSSEEKLKSYQYIMDSMTEQEQENPEIINASRVKRIALGSGRQEKEVREMLKQYHMSRKMIDKVKKGKKIRGLQGMLKNLGNMGGFT